MKIAIISDVHSNLEALERVLADIKQNGAEKIYCLGDIVGYGPYPKECLDLIRNRAEKIVRGNHEESVLDPGKARAELNQSAFIGVQFSRSKLLPTDLDFLNALPTKEIIESEELVLAHGSFSEPSAWNYLSEEEDAEEELLHTPTRICVVGHTHSPFVYDSRDGLKEVLPDNLELNKVLKYIINVGSVGQPRDGDCRASYGLFEFKDGFVYFTLHRVFYDIEKIEKSFRRAALPASLSERLFRGE
jgi:predicted phosphodiesterase